MTYTGVLSDAGEIDLTGVAETPEWALCHVITAGPQVRTPFNGSAHLVTHVGWIAFGDITNLGYGSQAYWNDPIWINGLRWQWAMPLGESLSTTRLRYYFSPGTEVYLLVAP